MGLLSRYPMGMGMQNPSPMQAVAPAYQPEQKDQLPMMAMGGLGGMMEQAGPAAPFLGILPGMMMKDDKWGAGLLGGLFGGF